MRVLVALDDSPASQRAAREAERLFARVDPEFLVINVARSSAGASYVTNLGAAMPGVDSVWDEWEQQEIARRTMIAALAEQVGLSGAEVIVECGDTARCICAAAEGHGVDLVVVGSRDRGALGRLLAPSVSAAVVRGTSRPVLVVSGEHRTTTAGR